MTMNIAFAVPGTLATQTGGTFYDRRLFESLAALGHNMMAVFLPESFPVPSEENLDETFSLLRRIPDDYTVIVDGLAYGALPDDRVAELKHKIIALVHHPLAEETGIDAALAAKLRDQETKNLKLASHIIVPSQHTSDILQAKYGVPLGSITVLQPGIDRTLTVIGKTSSPPLLLSVGLLHPRKGHDVLLRALATLTDLRWRTVIAGTPWDARYVEELRDLISRLHLGERVELAGLVTNEKRNNLYRQATVFALATRYEGYGIVFNEAMLHGLPIVSCSTGAVPDTVPNNVGILVEPDDHTAFAAALRSILKDDVLRLEMAARSRAVGKALPSWLDVARLAEKTLKAVSHKNIAAAS